MRIILSLCVLIAMLLSCAETKNKNLITASIMSSDELEQKALRNYQDNPKVSLESFKELAIQTESEGNIPKAALANLNVSNIYDEHFNDFNQSLFYANKSLSLWQNQKDEMQIANLKKYIGYLDGKLGNFDQAKEEIKEAIRLYNKMAYEQGIAVANFNLARVFFEEKKYESAIKPFEDGLKYWKEEENSGRVFTMNTFGMQLYRALGETEKAEEMQHENYVMITQVKLPETEVEKFKSLVK